MEKFGLKGLVINSDTIRGSTEAGREFVEDGRNGAQSPFHGTRAVNLTGL